METIKLDLIPGKKMPSLHASQYDDGREHGIDLFENGIAYKLDGTETLTINERKVDNNICSMDIENTFTGSSHIEFASFLQMCACAGSNFCELRISKGDVDLGTLNFILEVEPDPTADGIESESEIRSLERQIEEITEEVIGDDYYTKTQTNEAIANATEGKADTINVDTELAKKMNSNNPTGTGSLSLNRKAGSTVGSNSVALGTNTRATGTSTTALGNDTLAYGENSVAMGSGSSVNGTNSVAIGNHTGAKSNNQFVFGKYNKDDNNNAYAEIVGNGTTPFTKSNARTLDWQGNETLAGDLTYNGNKSLTSEISRLDGKIDALPEPMIFKGTLGTNGTIDVLPTASASNEGWTFKCITAGTYAGLTLKVGDTVTCFNPPNTSIYEWDISGYGDTDTDTWRAIKVNGTEKLANGISSGSLDVVDTDNIEAEFDNDGNKLKLKTKNIYTKTEVDAIVSDAIYNVLPDDTASGSIANFNTSVSVPLKSAKFGIDAKGGGGTPTTPIPIVGYDSVKVGYVDFNQLCLNGDFADTSNWVAYLANVFSVADNVGTFKANSGYAMLYKAISVISGHKYMQVFDVKGTSATNMVYRGFTGGGISNVNHKINLTTDWQKVFDFWAITENASNAQLKYIMDARSSGFDNIYIKNALFIDLTQAFGEEIADYLYALGDHGESILKQIFTKDYYPYNVGGTMVSVDSVNGEHTCPNVIIPLGQTVYGGYVTQDKDGHRQFEVTHKAKVKLRDVGYWNYSASGNRFYTNNVSDVLQKIDWNNHIGLCDCYVEGKVGNNQGDDMAYSFYNSSLYLRDSNYSDVTTWLNAVGDYYITYQLATPIIIDLPDGEPIITLTGVNNFFADTGDTEVVFKSSVNDYVNAHSGGNLLGMGGVYLGGAKSGGSEEDTDEGEDTEKTKEIDDPKEEIKTIGEKKIGGE